MRGGFQTTSLGKAYAVFSIVIPAQAGIHICSQASSDKNQETEYRLWIPACAGMTAVRLFSFIAQSFIKCRLKQWTVMSVLHDFKSNHQERAPALP